MKYLLGIDGGGSNTLALLVDETGRILGKGVGARANFHGVGVEAAIKSIQDAMEKALRQSGKKLVEIDTTCLGLAGIGRATDKYLIENALNKLIPSRTFFLEHDMMIALIAALSDGWGLILNAGTGAIAFGKDKSGTTHRADGWGYLLGDEGSGYSIGSAALRASLRSYDGRGPKTILENLLCQKLRLNSSEELVEAMNSQSYSPDFIASLSTLVFDAAKQRDEVSEKILSKATNDLFQTARAVIDKFGWEQKLFQACLTGGVFSRSSMLRTRVERKLNNFARKIQVVKPYLPPVCGALILAAERSEIKDKQKLMETLRTSVTEVDR